MKLLTLAQLVAAASAAPHVLVFLVDDLGYGDLGFTGHPTTRTPRLDALAHEGRRLRSWYSAYPVCSASRTALLTGRQPPRVGMVGVLNSLSSGGLPLAERTLADELRESPAAYATLALGKWHQGQTKPYLPAARGFDEFLGLPYSVDDGTGFASPCAPAAGGAAAGVAAADGEPRRVGLGPQLPLPLLSQAGGATTIVEQPTDLVPLTARLVNRSIDFVARAAAAARPAFVWFAFGHVHTATPDIPARQYAGCPFVNATARGPFGDALAEVDWAVGALMDAVAALGADANTLALFVSDNGPALRWGLSAGSAGPFVGAGARYANGTRYTNTAKGSTWEGGVRMPAFARWPGVIAPASRSDTVVSSLDVLPSVLRLAGLAASAVAPLDGGESLADALLWNASDARGRDDGTSAPTRHAFLALYNEPVIANASTRIFAARMGALKAHWITSPGLAPSDAGWTPAAEEAEHDPPLVFNVDADPAEAFPIAAEDLPPGTLDNFASAKAAYEAGLAPTAIDPTWGYEWALCCGYGCEMDDCECACENLPI